MESLVTFHEQYPLAVLVGLAAAILLATWAIEHVLFKVIKRIGQTGATPLPASTIFANIARVCIWLAGITIMTKVCFDYDLTAFIAALGVGGIALSLGLQDTLSNLIAGLQVSLSKLVAPGMYIEVLGQRGLVTDVTWRHTAILDPDGFTHLVPNSLINKNSLVDLGEAGDVKVAFLIPLDTNIDTFTADAVQAVEEALGGAIGPKGVRVSFAGEAYAGLSGNVVVHVLHRSYPPAVATNMIARAIDPVLKRTGQTV